MADIFVSYTSNDRDWAFWIGQELQALGHTPHIHDWEIPGGGDIATWMERTHDEADHILCVVSAAYLKAPYSSWERRAAQWAAAKDRPGFALPVLVEPCEVPTLLAPIKRCDLYGVGEADARVLLARFLAPGGPPTERPRFPGGATSSAPAVKASPAPAFPGAPALLNVPARVSDTFVSYAREDAGIVDELVGELIASGIDPWVDRFKAPVAGTGWFLDTQKELENAPCVLGCWTANAPDSEQIRDECDFAKDNGKLIPVRLQNVRPPQGYSSYRHYDLVGWVKDRSERSELDRLIADINARRRVPDANVTTASRTAGFKVRETYPPDFDDQLAKAATGLLGELSWIDQEFQFQNDWFTPLNADVEVHTGHGLDDRKIADLLTSIETDKTSPMFLVLGDPGAGKSVAMRELARHGLRLTPRSKTLFIYVNLREWLPAVKWTKQNPPDTRALEAFLQSYLASYGNNLLQDFFSEYLGRLHVDGRIFWIFDSFDEIPAVLDAGADAKSIVNALSSVLWRFIKQGSRGVISSRYHRKPELPPDLSTRLDVRPFGEDKIDAALRRVKMFPTPLISTLLRARQDLVPLARTPFYLGLIAEFGARQRRLPNTQVELFETYVLSRLGSDALRVEDVANPANKEVIRAAEDMAHFLLTSRYGLEAPRDVLRAEFPDIGIGAIIARLTQVRIMRTGRPPAFICSFAHRRIQEYFVIRHMVRTGVPFEHEWVALDSSMRDAAVLYVELAGDAEAEQIADHCWEEIATVPADMIDYASPAFWRALHCQRFLSEAFRGRLPALNSFQADMARRVEYTLAHKQELIEMLAGHLPVVAGLRRAEHVQEQDLITMKLAVETLGLLPEESIPGVLGAALQNGDPWIRESAVNASRFLPKVRPDLAGRIWRSIASMPDEEFGRERKRLSYAFQLASGLSEIGKLIKLRAEDNRNWRWYGLWIASAARFWHLVPVYFWRELMLRHPSDELAMLTAAEGNALADLEHDKTSGLSGYRKVLASTRLWRDASVAMFLAIAAISGWEMLRVIYDDGFGPSYSFAAVIYAFEAWSLYFLPTAFVATSLWIAPYFAGRSYPLTLPGEDIPRRTWNDRLGGVRRWGYWAFGAIVAIVFAIGLALVVGGVEWLLAHFAGSAWAATINGYVVSGWGILVGASLAVSALAGLIDILVRWARDRKVLATDRERLEAFKSADNSTRALIAAHFEEFQTEKGREKFVRWLNAQRLEATGEWPGGRPPNLGGNASSLLARLEHRWRKLDR
jgi:hypothetical protein